MEPAALSGTDTAIVTVKAENSPLNELVRELTRKCALDFKGPSLGSEGVYLDLTESRLEDVLSRLLRGYNYALVKTDGSARASLIVFGKTVRVPLSYPAAFGCDPSAARRYHRPGPASRPNPGRIYGPAVLCIGGSFLPAKVNGPKPAGTGARWRRRWCDHSKRRRVGGNRHDIERARPACAATDRRPRPAAGHTLRIARRWLGVRLNKLRLRLLRHVGEQHSAGAPDAAADTPVIGPAAPVQDNGEREAADCGLAYRMFFLGIIKVRK